MDAIDCQDAKSGQARRLKLLLKLIERCSCPEEALDLAERMERFVLSGSVEEPGGNKRGADGSSPVADLPRRQAANGVSASELPSSSAANGSSSRSQHVGSTACNATASANGFGEPILLCSPVDPSVQGHTTQTSGAVSDLHRAPTVNPKTGTVYTKRRWTPEEDEQLKKLAAEDQTLDQIARVLDRTPIGIRERARAKNIRIKPRKRGRQPAKPEANAHVRPANGRNTIDGKSPSRSQGNGPGRGALARKTKSRKKRPASDPKRDADMVRAFLLEHGPTKPTLTIDSVVKFMRTRDYSVVMGEDGRYIVDGRDRMTPMELVKRANELRIDLGQTAFPEQLGELDAPEAENGTPYLPIASAVQVPAHGPN